MTDILQYIGEATEYDKKLNVEKRKMKSWLKSVSAFANGVGGCLIFGIANDGTVAGLDDVRSDAEFVSQKIKERIDPVPQTVIKIMNIDGKNILLVKVLPGDDTPYYYIGDGMLETFVRIGDETVIAGATEHRRLVLRGRNLTFDARTSGEAFNDYAFTKLHERYYAWNGVSFDNKMYRSFGMVDNNGILTNAGLLMADECPLRQSRVFCTRWNGTAKGNGGEMDALDSLEISGSLVKLYEDTMRFIRRNMRTLWYKEPTQRVEIPEYIERSVTEAVVNAIAHRDYLIIGSEIHVDMYDDRMEIYSPGAMPEGRIIQNMDLRSIPSVRRNPVIADIFSQLGLMERKGSGMEKIIGPYRALPYFTENMMPTFFSDRAQFTVTFANIARLREKDADKHQAESGKPSRNCPETTQKLPRNCPETAQKDDTKDMPGDPYVRLSKSQTDIVRFLESNKYADRKAIASNVGLTDSGVKYNLSILQNKGIVRRIGPDKGGYWEILMDIRGK